MPSFRVEVSAFASFVQHFFCNQWLSHWQVSLCKALHQVFALHDLGNLGMHRLCAYAYAEADPIAQHGFDLCLSYAYGNVCVLPKEVCCESGKMNQCHVLCRRKLRQP